MANLPVCDAFVAPAYRNVHSEEGDYEAFCGYNLFAKVKSKDGYIETYLYTSGDEYGAAYVFPNEAKACVYAQLVKSADYLPAPDLWVSVHCSHPDDLPDYVTDPYRPEFN